MKLKDENPTELKWIIPFTGLWHTMKNFALALIKIYGPAGLEDLIALLHHAGLPSLLKIGNLYGI